MTDTPQPVTIPTPSRPARIAALHAAGLFLAEHLDLPMPINVRMNAHDLTHAQLEAISQLHGVPIKHHGDSASVHIIVTLETLHGIEIEYCAYGQLPATTPADLPPRVGVVLPEQDSDPWADVMPRPTPRCTARWDNTRCVHPDGHSPLVPHFYDDDETSTDHQHREI